MSPGLLLSVLLGVTLAALLADGLRRGRRRDAVRRLAAGRRMNFGRTDTLQLTPRVARHFPAPGAAALRVCDVVYGADGDAYRYVFTAEYTLGVTGAKRRHTRVAAFTEPRDRRRGGRSELVLGEEGTPLLEQYAALVPSTRASAHGAPATHLAPEELNGA
ncbi:MAG: hypothetical protein AVDCRST_MAG64-2498 [uncultured Phycisphaerae bacterium]|uniref:Uncharacterized protein n=1 Tax=uncultured Phycisphaerae bacterium TaxID=904963 RepID=A0A6J4PGK0_9BACT|nr:MAG: hypothetical protein AVDCRST_MAG64-2498 [uncultured Phycisphaerae bacterium]